MLTAQYFSARGLSGVWGGRIPKMRSTSNTRFAGRSGHCRAIVEGPLSIRTPVRYASRMSVRNQHSGSVNEVFHTDRLVVRKWRSADEPDLFALYNIKEVVRWIDDGQALSASEAARWMEVTHSNY